MPVSTGVEKVGYIERRNTLFRLCPLDPGLRSGHRMINLCRHGRPLFARGIRAEGVRAEGIRAKGVRAEGVLPLRYLHKLRWGVRARGVHAGGVLPRPSKK